MKKRYLVISLLCVVAPVAVAAYYSTTEGFTSKLEGAGLVVIFLFCMAVMVWAVSKNSRGK